MKRRQNLIVPTFLCGMSVMWAAGSPISLAQHATPEAAAPSAITSEVLGRAAPVSVANPQLALGRVTVMPGAVLPVHYHPGTQIGFVVQGELTYSVFSGEIEWHRGDDPTGEPYRIGPGETVVVVPGDALVESPDSIHQGRNDGAVPLVIYLSTLFPTDAPRAIIVEATPVP
jgi:quercetin dioxygenase-like cupin family protein